MGSKSKGGSFEREANKNIFYVYIYMHPITGVPFYVGKGKGKRAYSHLNTIKYKGEKSYCVNTIIKIVKETGFNPVISFHATKLSEIEAFNIEQELIIKYGRKDRGGILTNRTDGGEGPTGLIFSKETLKKLSLASSGENNPMYGLKGALSPNYGKTQTQETKNKKAKVMTGKNKGPHTKEHNLKISNGGKGKSGRQPGYHLTEEHCKNISKANSGENNPIYGTHRSKETKLKISKKLTGKRQTPETIRKSAESRTGKKASVQAIINMSIAQTGHLTTVETGNKISAGLKLYWKNKRDSKNE